MKIGAFITITRPEERGDTYKECIAMANDCFDVVTIIDGKDTWPQQFSWNTISKHFQWGYEQCDADWVFHLDCDFIFHERDFDRIRAICERYDHAPALSFWKYQFILPDRYSIKSRLVVAVNKRRYGDRIKFNSGGDFCQPSLDNLYITAGQIPEARIPFYCYEKIAKTEEQIKDDVTRMANAWYRYFMNYKLGTDKTAYKEWLRMVIGRFKKPQEHILLSEHPKYIQDTILGLNSSQWGYSGFDKLVLNDYIKNK